MWLSMLHMSQYEQTLLDAGYDDIDFICDVALDDLHDIGISKRGECIRIQHACVCIMCIYMYNVGHVKRLLRGIGEMTELMKGGPPFLSPVRVPVSQTLESLLPPPPPSTQHTEPSHHTPAPATVEPILPPPHSWTDVPSDEPERVDFALMKRQMEMNMGAKSENSDKHTIGHSSLPTTSHTAPSLAPRQGDWYSQESSQPPPQLPPKRNRKSPSHDVSVREASRGAWPCKFVLVALT